MWQPPERGSQGRLLGFEFRWLQHAMSCGSAQVPGNVSRDLAYGKWSPDQRPVGARALGFTREEQHRRVPRFRRCGIGRNARD